MLRPENDSVIFDVAFAPTGDKIAFVLARELSNGNWDVQIAESRVDGSRLRVLTSSDTGKNSPKYSFDGSKIIFEAQEPCPPNSLKRKYCGADAYEFDIDTGRERRITDLRTLQVRPVSFLPGNNRMVLTAYGSSNPRGKRYEEGVDVEKVYGDKQRVFVVARSEPDKMVPIVTGTATATSPKALPSGETAFISKVNDYDGVKDRHGYDVFIHGSTGTRRLTRFGGYIRDYGISDSAQLVAIVTETSRRPPEAELLLWTGASGQTRKFQCDEQADERPLLP